MRRRRYHSSYNYIILLLALCYRDATTLSMTAMTMTSSSSVLDEIKTLEEILLIDIFGDVLQDNDDSPCRPIPNTFRHTFQPPPNITPSERTLFLAELSHTSPTDPTQSWTIRIGRGGNIYSFLTSRGDIIPPSSHHKKNTISSVFQSTTLESSRFFVRQSGSYYDSKIIPNSSEDDEDDEETTSSSPLYSPNIAKWCSSTECRFASWGRFGDDSSSSSMSRTIYVTRYRDCGDGVLEMTTVIHHADDGGGDDDDLSTNTNEDSSSNAIPLDIVNLPWLTIRNSLLPNLYIPSSSPSSTTTTGHNLPYYLTNPTRLPLSSTDGYLLLTATPPPPNPFTFPGTPLSVSTRSIPRFRLGAIGDEDPRAPPVSCAPYGAGSLGYEAYEVRCRLMTYVEYKGGCPGCRLTLRNVGSGMSVEVVNVKHWSLRTFTPSNPYYIHHKHYHIYMAPRSGYEAGRILTPENYDERTAQHLAREVNNVLTSGSDIHISWTEEEGYGEDEEDFGMAFVFGNGAALKRGEEEVEEEMGGRSRSAPETVTYGSLYDWKSQTTIATLNPQIHLPPGSTYGHTHYFLTSTSSSSPLKTLPRRASLYTPHSLSDLNTIGELPSTTISLLFKADSSFGIALGDDDTSSSSSSSSQRRLRQCRGEVECVGRSTPVGQMTVPHFEMRCSGTKGRSYFGPMRRDNGSGLLECPANEELRVKLVGYFKMGDCEGLKDLTVDEEWCRGEGLLLEDEMKMDFTDLDLVSPIDNEGGTSSRPKIDSSAVDDDLEELLLGDIFGDLIPYSETSQCQPSNASGSFSYHFSLPTPSTPYESSLFLAELSHASPSYPSQSWTIRIGRGGNIYSLTTPLGESLPPNTKNPFVDDVFQTIAVDTSLPSSPNETYFIRQAGANPLPNTTSQQQPPMGYSPTLAKWCSTPLRECRFASWGQQALPPTPYLSHTLFLTRYRDCGSGVIEYTSAVHNFENPLADHLASFRRGSPRPTLGYVGIPRLALRDTVYRDVLVRGKEGGWRNPVVWPIPPAGVPERVELRDTGGYTVFAEQRKERPAFTFPGYFAEARSKIPSLKLVNGAGRGGTVSCHPWKEKSMGFSVYYFRCRIDAGREYRTGCEGCEVTFHTTAGGSLEVVTVVHWSSIIDVGDGGYYIAFAPKMGQVANVISTETYDETKALQLAMVVNNVLKVGEVIDVSWTLGKDDEDNHCLALVHGVDKEIQEGKLDRYWEDYGHISYGGGMDYQRQTLLFQEILGIWIDPGTTFGKTQYLVTSQGLSTTSNLASSYVHDVVQDFNNVGDLKSTPITLILSLRDESFFGISLRDEFCDGRVACHGTSTPQLDTMKDFTIPHFVITCGEESYFGPDLYHFSPRDDDDVRQSSVCNNNPSLSPKVKLVGFFTDGGCVVSFRKARYDPTYCRKQRGGFSPSMMQADMAPGPGPGPVYPTIYPSEEPTPSSPSWREETDAPSPNFFRTRGPHSMKMDAEDEQGLAYPVKVPIAMPAQLTTPADKFKMSPANQADLNNFLTYPTRLPVISPIEPPKMHPSIAPVRPPTSRPTNSPTRRPTLTTTKRPTLAPTKRPTSTPTKAIITQSDCQNDNSNWMSGHHGISIRITAGYNYITSHFNVAHFIHQITTHLTSFHIKWIVINLTSPMKGDRYLAPHSILTKLNPGSTPKYTNGIEWTSADPPPISSSFTTDRDLFGELLTALLKINIRTIAYIAAQGPSLLLSGQRQAYDYNGESSIVDSCAECPGLTGTPAPFCGCAPSVWRWNKWVQDNYGSQSRGKMQLAFAERIIGEYAKRYGEQLAGWMVDQAFTADMARIYLVAKKENKNCALAFNKGRRMPLMHNNFPYEDFTMGYTLPMIRQPASDCQNFPAVKSVEDKSSHGFFCVNKKGSLGHVLTLTSEDWSSGDLVWDIDQAQEWQSRVMNAKGAWTWSVKLGYGNDRDNVHQQDLEFLKAVYGGLRTRGPYLYGCGEEPKETSRPTKSPVTPIAGDLGGLMMQSGLPGGIELQLGLGNRANVPTPVVITKTLTKSPTQSPTKTPTHWPTQSPTNKIIVKTPLRSLTRAHWMASHHGISIRIMGGFNWITSNFKTRRLLSQIKDNLVPHNMKWIILNLSSPYNGDRYLAPHSLLTSMNIGSTPARFEGKWRDARPYSSEAIDFDLFGELMDGFAEMGIKTIAYVAAQGPAMLSTGESKAYDYNNNSPYVDSCKFCPRLTDNKVPFCRCAPSVWRWKQHVKDVYGSDDDDTLKLAFAEIIVGEYAERYGTRLAGFFFDQGGIYADKLKIYEVTRRHNPDGILAFDSIQKTPLKQYNFPYEDVTYGGPVNLHNTIPSSCDNYPNVINIEETDYGCFVVNRKPSLGHLHLPTGTDWAHGSVVWNVGQGREWMMRVMTANGAWTWGVKRGVGKDFSVIDEKDLEFLLNVYKGLDEGPIYMNNCD